MTIAEETWLGETVEVISPNTRFTGLRGTIAEVIAIGTELLFGVDIPVGYEHNQVTLSYNELAVV